MNELENPGLKRYTKAGSEATFGGYQTNSQVSRKNDSA